MYWCCLRKKRYEEVAILENSADYFMWNELESKNLVKENLIFSMLGHLLGGNYIMLLLLLTLSFS